LRENVIIDKGWPLQEIPHFAALEIIGPRIGKDKIMSIAKTNGVIDPQVYQWKGHTVLYGKLNHIGHLKNDLAMVFPKAEIKTYDTPLYSYNKFERCENPELALEWEHILLTANLVRDEKLQQEYLEYHKTQFEKWPEVAKGFCNADFQQLQVFKNGRQLMLVISIPKGESLDDLNPKTTENNPRVNEWNALMKKYQVGIKGTKSNEIWAVLKKLD
jgi:L-rhamnose mutarotase